MSHELPTVDVAETPELLRLAEEVRRSGVGRLLTRGEQPLAVLAPVTQPAEERPAPAVRRRRAQSAEPDPILSIVGIGSSSEPTDIAHRKDEYLAEAYDERSR